MAVFTGIGGLYVNRSLAGGGNAVVTAKAVSDNPAVIKHGGGPQGAGMAVTAGVAAGHMVGIFASGDAAVVARLTSADDRNMVNRGGRRPDAVRMAVQAGVVAFDMECGLRGGADAAGGGVAAGTGGGYTDKNAVLMAAGTVHLGVGAGQREAGGKVVKILAGRLRLGKHWEKSHQ